MPSKRMPNWAKTRKPHNRRVQKIRHYVGHEPNFWTSTELRSMYSSGGAPTRRMGGVPKRMTNIGTQRTAFLRKEYKAIPRRKTKQRLMQIHTQSVIKDARMYAAHLKKTNPKAFDNWFETGFLSGRRSKKDMQPVDVGSLY